MQQAANSVTGNKQRPMDLRCALELLKQLKDAREMHLAQTILLEQRLEDFPDQYEDAVAIFACKALRESLENVRNIYRLEEELEAVQKSTQSI